MHSGQTKSPVSMQRIISILFESIKSIISNNISRKNIRNNSKINNTEEKAQVHIEENNSESYELAIRIMFKLVLDAVRANRSIRRTVLSGHLAGQLGGQNFRPYKKPVKNKRAVI
ncbi:hypothetical protein BpHYR1_051982 [Brachionus plicatilis]|uniref:Uncharacterized protein n=1 Tax=Brachionus plicatilis TaxID=10195 RepID=A0A3M7P4K0_BRAPC|nr:hypothetical protein BpHYR1_051982 [Brachionus plicatilis]